MTTTKRRSAAKAAKKRSAASSSAKSAAAAPPPQPPPPEPERIMEGPRPCTEFQYAVKLVQGSPPPLTAQNFFAPGRYFTAVNVHNPSTCKTVKFRWKVALANRGGKADSTITTFREARLRPDEALEIDANHIARALGVTTPTQFLKGFVVLESPCELDVVAVYTALPAGQGPGAQSSGLAFHTERVPARKIEACLDLRLDISTGVVPWTVTSVPSGATGFPSVPYTATVIQNANVLTSPPWATQPGALWISARGFVNSKPTFAPGWYVFRYCFTLCSGFTNPALNMKAMVDDEGWVRLNGLWMGQPGPFPSTPHIPFSLLGPPVTVQTISSGFLPGRNCLEILVLNGTNTHPTNPVGLNLRAELTAERGACPGGCGCCEGS